MRLYHYLPEYDFVEKHEINVHASPEKVFQAIKNLNSDRSVVIRTLFSIREAYARMGASRDSFKKGSLLKLSFYNLLQEKGPFILLEEFYNEEIVIGIVGQFWKLWGGIRLGFSADDFKGFTETGHCKVAANFLIIPIAANEVRLSTETRILCLGRRAKRAFSLYWMVVKIFSGWIRIEMLKIIKGEAEKLDT